MLQVPVCTTCPSMSAVIVPPFATRSSSCRQPASGETLWRGGSVPEADEFVPSALSRLPIHHFVPSWRQSVNRPASSMPRKQPGQLVSPLFSAMCTAM